MLKNIVISIVLLFLAACTTTVNNLSSEERVKARSQERLDALVKKDFKKAYSYASPGYRANVQYHNHVSKVLGAKLWTAGVVDSVECEPSGDVCDVVVSVTYYFPQAKMKNTRPLKEKWIYIDEEWWIYHN